MDQIEVLKKEKKHYEGKTFKNETLKEIIISLYDEAIECVEQLNRNNEKEQSLKEEEKDIIEKVEDTIEIDAILFQLNKLEELISILEKLEYDISADNSDVGLEIYKLTKGRTYNILELKEKVLAPMDYTYMGRLSDEQIIRRLLSEQLHLSEEEINETIGEYSLVQAEAGVHDEQGEDNPIMRQLVRTQVIKEENKFQEAYTNYMAELQNQLRVAGDRVRETRGFDEAYAQARADYSALVRDLNPQLIANEKFETLISDLAKRQLEFVKNKKKQYEAIIKRKHEIEETITNGTLLDNKDEQLLLEKLIISLYDKQMEDMDKLSKAKNKKIEEIVDRYKETSELIPILGNLGRQRGNSNLEDYIVKLRTKQVGLKNYNLEYEDLGKLIKILEDKQKNYEATDLQKVEEVCEFLRNNALEQLRRSGFNKKDERKYIKLISKCNFNSDLANAENISKIISLMKNPNYESRISLRGDYINVKAMNLCLVLNLERNGLLDDLINRQNQEIGIINKVLSPQAQIDNVSLDSIMTHILNCDDLTEQLNMGRIYANKYAHFCGDAKKSPLDFYNQNLMEKMGPDLLKNDSNSGKMKIKDFLVGNNYNYAKKDEKINIEKALIRYFTKAVIDKVRGNKITLYKGLYKNTKDALEEKLKKEYSIDIEKLSEIITESCNINQWENIKYKNYIRNYIENCVNILLGVNNNENLKANERKFKTELDNQKKQDKQMNAKILKKIGEYEKVGFYLKQFYTKSFYYMYSERKK